LAYTELSRQLQATTHNARRQQLTNALAELERQLQALGAPTH
jgi:galactokinase